MYLLSTQKSWVLQLKETEQNSCIFPKPPRGFNRTAAPSKQWAVEDGPKPPLILTPKALGCSKISLNPTSAMPGCEGLSTESSLVSNDSRAPFHFPMQSNFQAEPQFSAILPYSSFMSATITKSKAVTCKAGWHQRRAQELDPSFLAPPLPSSSGIAFIAVCVYKNLSPRSATQTTNTPSQTHTPRL